MVYGSMPGEDGIVLSVFDNVLLKSKECSMSFTIKKWHVDSKDAE
jgi:hypothetical protein